MDWEAFTLAVTALQVYGETDLAARLDTARHTLTRACDQAAAYLRVADQMTAAGLTAVTDLLPQPQQAPHR